MSLGQIAYDQDNFPLSILLEPFRFFFDLHNLPSALPSDPDLRGAHSRILQMEQQVRGAKLEGFTTKKTGKRGGSKNVASNASSGNSRSAPFGDATTLRRLSNARYQIVQRRYSPD